MTDQENFDDDINRLLEENSESFEPTEFEQVEPTGQSEADTPAGPEFEPFPVDTLSIRLRKFVVEAAASIAVDAACIAPFAMSAISGLMGRMFQIQVKQGYYEFPSIWSAVVLPSGGSKTPAFDAVMDPIQYLQNQANDEYDTRWTEYQQEEEAFFEWKKDQKRKSKPLSIELPREKPIEPIREQLIIDEPTTEAMIGILSQNPLGVILGNDELSQFFGTVDAYHQSQKDASFWCKIFNGKSISQNRKTGIKYVSAKTPSVSIFGGIQPDILKDILLKNPDFFSMGLAARFLFSLPQEIPNYHTENIISGSTMAGYIHIINGLVAMRRSGHFSADNPVTVQMSQEAKHDVWIPFQRANVDERMGMSTDNARAAWAKLQTYSVRFALFSHVTHWIESKRNPAEFPIDIPFEVSGETVWNAIQKIEWYKGQIIRMLEKFGGGGINCDREAMTILQAINENGGSITVRELQRKRSRYQKTGGSEKAEKKFQKMVSQGLLKSEYVRGETGPAKTIYRKISGNANDTFALKPEENSEPVIVIEEESEKTQIFIHQSKEVPLPRKQPKEKKEVYNSYDALKREDIKDAQKTLFD